MKIIPAALAAIALILAACSSDDPTTTQSHPVLTCHEHEVAVWTNYPVAYRCVPDDAHEQHDG
jgi:type IV pilus biogenesis protein CpaD/CtpE